MCTKALKIFGRTILSAREIRGKKILEIGSRNINYSLRPHCNSRNPFCYVGVDISTGKGVDQLCSVYDLISTFGYGIFDVVISTEMLEHIENWQLAIYNMKQVCAPGGIILITTRSIGFPEHGYPDDWWRFQEEDMKVIFGDFGIAVLEKDLDNGICIKAVKPIDYVYPKDLNDYEVYSMKS